MRLQIPIALLLGLAGCGEPPSMVTVTIESPRIRLSAVPGQPAAGYATIAATPDHGALTGVSSPRAQRIEMHETMASGSMSSMRPLDRIDLAKEDEIDFVPGGRHLMLFGVDPALKAGDHADLIFHFAHGAPARVAAKVVAAGHDASH